jgi:hypothetical protein
MNKMRRYLTPSLTIEVCKIKPHRYTTHSRMAKFKNKKNKRPDMVAHAYNSSYLRWRW